MIYSDLEADKDRCQRCGSLLHKYYGGHELYPTLRMYDGDIVYATMVDIRCASCGAVNEIFYIADMLPTISTTPTRRGGFAWVPAI